MSWEIAAGGGYGSDDEDDWANDDEVTKMLSAERREEILKKTILPQCGYNECLTGLIQTLAEDGVEFKVFGGAAYVHHACGDESATNVVDSPCRTHDVDLYLRDDRDNKEKFDAALGRLKKTYRFDDLDEKYVDFEGHSTKLIKWKTNVDPGDGGVEHGIDVHYVGNDDKIWGDSNQLAQNDKHFVTPGQLCETLSEMVKGKGGETPAASSMDGDDKNARRAKRYEKLCERSSEPRPTIGGNPALTIHGAPFSKAAGLNNRGLREMAERTAVREIKRKSKQVAEKAGEKVGAIIYSTRSD